MKESKLLIDLEELLQKEKPVKLYYDSPRGVEPGHYLVAIGNNGKLNSVYLVCRITNGGKNPRRKYLVCIRANDVKEHIERIAPPEYVRMKDAVIHPVFWYKREKKKS